MSERLLPMEPKSLLAYYSLLYALHSRFPTSSLSDALFLHLLPFAPKWAILAVDLSRFGHLEKGIEKRWQFWGKMTPFSRVGCRRPP